MPPSTPWWAGLVRLTSCPDCDRPRRQDERGCPQCGLSGDAFAAIARVQRMYMAACVELAAANQTSIAQIIAVSERTKGHT